MTTEPRDDEEAAIEASRLRAELWPGLREERHPRYRMLVARFIARVLSPDNLPIMRDMADLRHWHQRVRIEVCERTGLSLEEWKKLTKPAREPYIEQALTWKAAEFKPFAPDELAPLIPPEPQPQLHPVEPTADDAPQYVTRDQIAALVQRHKDTVADWFNRDDKAPQAAVEGGGGERYEYVWSEVRPWLEAKTGRKLPARFPGAP
jgi:hypothetical protein